jgi:hypothetical protein
VPIFHLTRYPGVSILAFARRDSLCPDRGHRNSERLQDKIRSMAEKVHIPAFPQDGLPEVLRPFFWDADFEKLSLKGNHYPIIGRLLELGDETAIQFLLKVYTRDEIVSTLRRSRSLSRRSRVFWAMFFDVDDESCTPKRYPTPYGTYSRD